MPNPVEYYGKVISWGEIKSIFKDNIVVFSDAEKTSKAFRNSSMIVPHLILECGTPTKDILDDFENKGIVCSALYTGEGEGTLCLL